MAMEISFPGGKKVDADFKGFTIKTDQAERDGGEGSAPTPTFLFLASLGTCAGIYALNFCESRPLDFVAFSLKSALDNLAKLTGESIDGEVLDNIFSKFCIGK